MSSRGTVHDRPLLMLAGVPADEFPRRVHPSRVAGAPAQASAWPRRSALQRLTLDETGLATTLILGGELPAPRDVVEAVYERTNGIPLHIEELLAALGDEARPTAARSAMPRAGHDRRRRPRPARAPVGRRAAGRPSRRGDRSMLRPDVIAGISDRPIAELEPPLDELVDSAILYPFDYVDQGYYDFRHQLLRDAIYGDVPPPSCAGSTPGPAEFGDDPRGREISMPPATTSARACGRGVPGGPDRRARTAAGSRPGTKRSSCTGERSRTCRRTCALGEQAELYERFDAAAAVDDIEATRSPRAAAARGSCTSEAGDAARCRGPARSDGPSARPRTVRPPRRAFALIGAGRDRRTCRPPERERSGRTSLGSAADDQGS